MYFARNSRRREGERYDPSSNRGERESERERRGEGGRAGFGVPHALMTSTMTINRIRAYVKIHGGVLVLDFVLGRPNLRLSNGDGPSLFSVAMIHLRTK